MAHFAKLGTGNIVEKVVVVSNDIATTEQAGIDFLNNLYKTRDVWKQTSYNRTILEKIMLVLVILMTKH
jgi:DNA phosphorothioation-dependent restriction protein DptG